MHIKIITAAIGALLATPVSAQTPVSESTERVVQLTNANNISAQTPFVTNESLEVPGMMLAPGRYVLRLIEPGVERNVLQVFEVVQLWSGDEKRLLSTMLTMPNYDRPITDKTVFAFLERGPKQPKALRLWFSPGRNYGQEFVYPKAQAVELAKAVGRGVLSMPPELHGDIGLLAGGVQRGGCGIRSGTGLASRYATAFGGPWTCHAAI
jgi:hypothetical protein